MTVRTWKIVIALVIVALVVALIALLFSLNPAQSYALWNLPISL